MAQDKPTDAINWDIPIHDAGRRMLPGGLLSRAYTFGSARVLVTHDPQPDGTFLWHMSISCADRNPTWREMVTARYRILAFVEEMAMYLPPLSEYVNCHPFTFHWHEAPRDKPGRTDTRSAPLWVPPMGKDSRKSDTGEK